MTRAQRIVAVLSSIVFVSLLIALSLTSRKEVVTGDRPIPSPSNGVRPGPGLSEGGSYPDDWKTSLADAVRGASFTVVVPAVSGFSESDVGAVFLYPGGRGVALQYPLDQELSSPLRFTYIEINEQAIDGPYDAGKEIARDLEQSPADGKFRCEIDSLPALCVEAHSKDDAELANPSYVKFLAAGIQFEIFGGEDLDLLRAVATDISHATRSRA